MNDQCNICGGFENLKSCEHCSTIICGHCKLRHVPLCEELKKRKKRGEGPTIANVSVPQHRAGHETPATTGADRPDWAAKFGKSTKDGAITWTNVSSPVDPVDQGLDAVKDLLGEK